MEKILNKLGNIIFYSLNFITAPILIFWVIGYVLGVDNIVSSGNEVNGFYVFLGGVLSLLYWRFIFLIGTIFYHHTKFGLDFFKYNTLFKRQSELKPYYNEKIEPKGLYTLFKKYCLDETIDIKHNKSSVDKRQFDFDKLTQIDTQCLWGLNSTFIGRVDKNCFGGYENGVGYKISLKENPPLFMFPVNSRFFVKFPMFGICNKWEKQYLEDINKLKQTYEISTQLTNWNSNGLKDNETNITQYAICMGDIIEFITYDQHRELMTLHKKAESNYSNYMLKKRLEEK